LKNDVYSIESDRVPVQNRACSRVFPMRVIRAIVKIVASRIVVNYEDCFDGSRAGGSDVLPPGQNILRFPRTTHVRRRVFSRQAMC
jgi:hypothetical protein